jgi:hypothetical protein
MSTVAPPKNEVINAMNGKICLCGIFVVGLCAWNVFHTSYTLSPLLSWTRDALALVQEEDSTSSPLASATLPYIPYTSRSPLTVPTTQMISTTNRFTPKLVDDISQPDRRDPIFRRSGWDNDPVVVEKYQLLFFTLPKNSCTEWKRLFRRMMNYSNWRMASPHDPASNGLRYLGHYKSSQQIEYMTSPNWTRAIFVREPMERLLSGFLDKAYGPEMYLYRHCCVKKPVTIRTE